MYLMYTVKNGVFREHLLGCHQCRLCGAPHRVYQRVLWDTIGCINGCYGKPLKVFTGLTQGVLPHLYKCYGTHTKVFTVTTQGVMPTLFN